MFYNLQWRFRGKITEKGTLRYLFVKSYHYRWQYNDKMFKQCPENFHLGQSNLIGLQLIISHKICCKCTSAVTKIGEMRGNIQLMESSFHPSASSVSHSYSSNNLGQMQFDSSSIGAFRSPHRSQMRLQSRRSQSREDLNSSLAETHIVKV